MDIQHIAVPVAGKDYPRNWSEFLDWFANEQACLAYLQKLRWPDGFVCPACGVVGEPYRSSRARLMRRGCGHEGSATAGTIFDKTRTPLRVWLAAAWYVTNQKLGVSALGLKRVLGLGSYETAWTMLHRFRRAMVREERELLKGEVEVDETYLAISDRDKPLSSQGRKNKTSKILVAIAVEIHQPKGFGRIRLRRIDDDSDACVVPFVKENIEPGARVRTDGSAAYRSLSKIGFEHNRQIMLGAEVTGPRHDARRAPSGLLGQALDPGHASWLGPTRPPRRLPRRVRLSLHRRTSTSRGMLFYRLMTGRATAPVTDQSVIKCLFSPTPSE